MSNYTPSVDLRQLVEDISKVLEDFKKEYDKLEQELQLPPKTYKPMRLFKKFEDDEATKVDKEDTSEQLELFDCKRK